VFQLDGRADHPVEVIVPAIFQITGDGAPFVLMANADHRRLPSYQDRHSPRTARRGASRIWHAMPVSRFITLEDGHHASRRSTCRDIKALGGRIPADRDPPKSATCWLQLVGRAILCHRQPFEEEH